jgi:hypothetical protein
VLKNKGNKIALYILIMSILCLLFVPFIGVGVGLSNQDSNLAAFSNAHLFSKDANSSLLASSSCKNSELSSDEWDTIFKRHNVSKYSSLSALFPVSSEWKLTTDKGSIYTTDFLGTNYTETSDLVSTTLLKILLPEPLTNVFSAPNQIVISDKMASSILAESGEKDLSNVVGVSLLATRGDEKILLVVGGVYSESVVGVYLNHFYASNFTSPCFFLTGADSLIPFEKIDLSLSWTHGTNKMIYEDFLFYSNQYGFKISFPDLPANKKTYNGISFQQLSSAMDSHSLVLSISLSVLGFSFLIAFFVLFHFALKKGYLNLKQLILLVACPIVSLIICVFAFRKPFLIGGLYYSLFSTISSWLSLLAFVFVEGTLVFLLFKRLPFQKRTQSKAKQVDLSYTINI